jgi:hypothetical protein
MIDIATLQNTARSFLRDETQIDESGEMKYGKRNKDD